MSGQSTKQPAKRLSLRRNFVWILAGSTVENGAKWVIFALLTKFLAADVVGSFSLALAVATPITILAQLQLRVALITDARDEFPFGAYHALRVIAVVASGIVILGVGMAMYGTGLTGALIGLVGLSQVMASLRDIWVGLAQKQERMDVTATGNIIDGMSSLALFALALLCTENILLATLGIVVARFATLVFYDMPRARTTVPGHVSTALVWNRAILKKLFWVALPLGSTTALVSLNSYLPQYFIEIWIGRDKLGYFAAITYFVFAARLVIAALGRAASPRLARLYHKDRKAFGRLLVKLLVIGAVLGGACMLVFVVWGDTFLGIAYSAEYAAHADLLVVLMLAGSIRFLNSFLGTAVSAARYFLIQPVIYGVVSATTVASCVLLIPSMGLQGAAWATVIVAAINALINGGVTLYIYRRMPDPALMTT